MKLKEFQNPAFEKVFLTPFQQKSFKPGPGVTGKWKENFPQIHQRSPGAFVNCTHCTVDLTSSTKPCLWHPTVVATRYPRWEPRELPALLQGNLRGMRASREQDVCLVYAIKLNLSPSTFSTSWPLEVPCGFIYSNLYTHRVSDCLCMLFEPEAAWCDSLGELQCGEWWLVIVHAVEAPRISQGTTSDFNKIFSPLISLHVDGVVNCLTGS